MSRVRALLFVTLLLGCPGFEVRTGPRKEEPERQPKPQPQPQPQPAPTVDVYPLPARWRPLERIERRAAFPGLSSSAATTVSPVVYVQDLQGWLKKYPPGTAHFDAVMLHEQVHARRQVAAGVEPWVQRYGTDRAFMWAEEQRGWFEQIMHLRRSGFSIDPAAVGRALAKYRNLAGAMVTQEEGQRWAQEVLQGRWQPPP